jgi:CBS domain containing-hemolysin-like protein
MTEGVLEESESTIINNVLNFENVIVRDIMTPRSVTFMMDQGYTVEQYLEDEQSSVHSRVPIYQDEKDNVTGFVLKDELLAAKGEGRGKALLSEFKRDIVSIPDTMPLPRFMKLTAKDKQHIHIVFDEFGHVLGIVTMEDLIETLLGTEIVDESDVVVDLQDHARKKWEEKKGS